MAEDVDGLDEPRVDGRVEGCERGGRGGQAVREREKRERARRGDERGEDEDEEQKGKGRSERGGGRERGQLRRTSSEERLVQDKAFEVGKEREDALAQ